VKYQRLTAHPHAATVEDQFEINVTAEGAKPARAALLSTQHFGQLGEVRRHPPRLVPGDGGASLVGPV